MRLSMNQINQILAFFTTRIAPNNRAVKGWIEKIEYFKTQEGIMTENGSEKGF